MQLYTSAAPINFVFDMPVLRSHLSKTCKISVTMKLGSLGSQYLTDVSKLTLHHRKYKTSECFTPEIRYKKELYIHFDIGEM